jgi:Family of unknown function (DUF6489)
MKITVDVDCTPEEARRFLGLPDLAPVHEAYIAKMVETVEKGVTPDMLTSMLKTWSPMGDAGMKMWQSLLEQATGGTKR